MTNYTETLTNDLFIKAFKAELLNGIEGESKTLPQTVLTGGAVVDILRGVVPKDYDFIHNKALENLMRKNLKFKLSYTSRSAITFLYNDTPIQLLYKSPESFAYTIEQSEYSLGGEILKNFDEQSFVNRILVPTELAFKSKGTARIGIKRLLHWQHKGWTLQNITFQSLCDVAFKDSKKCKSSDDDENEES